LPLIVFEDSGTQVVYCPALELTGYGKNESEAENSFQTSLGEFILYTTRKNTLRDELVKMGWKIRKSKLKPMLPPDMTEMLANNPNFSHIFNNYPFRKFNQSIVLPA
jgi:hypothetical protein